jgi:hypothetical protein
MTALRLPAGGPRRGRGEATMAKKKDKKKDKKNKKNKKK